VQRRARTVTQEVWPLLQVQSDVVQRSLAVTDSDHELVADEDEDLAGLDERGPADPANSLEDGEQQIPVRLYLRALVRLDRVLDGELVKLESRRTNSNSSAVGSKSPIQTKAPGPRAAS